MIARSRRRSPLTHFPWLGAGSLLLALATGLAWSAPQQDPPLPPLGEPSNAPAATPAPPPVDLPLPELGATKAADEPQPEAKEPAPESAETAPARPNALPKARPVTEPVVEREDNGPAAIGRGSIVRLFAEANPLLWPLLLCSVVALGFGLERMIALRRERVIPREFVNRFLERLSGGKLDKDRAAELCRANDSTMARVFAVVVSYWGQPAAVIRQAIGFDASGEVMDLKRNIRVLNGTATLAPLLGLLGTVVGMIQSFDALGGRVGTAKGEALAQGISLALVATAIGLAIAVFSVALYYYLLNRVDILVRELDANARKVIELVAAESVRPAPVPERRPNFLHPGDHPRHESRAH